MNKSAALKIIFITLIFLSAFIIIAAHLYYIQIVQHDFFKQKAHHQYSLQITHQPPRGIIYDRHGQPLALNQETVAAFILPNHLESPERVHAFLKEYYPAALKRLQEKKDAQFMYIKRKLTPADIERIEQAHCNDIKLLKEPNRCYPNNAATHIVGITDIDNKGLFGIELIFNEQLKGSPGIVTLEKDARSGYFHFNKTTLASPKPGTDVHLTIDSTLQFLVTEELKKTIETYKSQEGAVLVVDPSNGHILAMAQWPIAQPHSLQATDIALTKNKCITEKYELGSVIKIFLALAALEENVVTPHEYIDCQNNKTGYVNGIKVTTWPHGHGTITFQEVIQYSNNIGVAQVALRLGPQLYEHYRRLGFGTKLALNWPGQPKGYVNPPHKWTAQSPISLSFGYEISTTLLQLARAFGIIACDGFAIEPTLLLHNEQPKGPRLYRAETISHINDILEKTVNQGTARKAALKGYSVRAKTGTANTLKDGIYNKEHNIYTVAGIIQKGSYQRLIITFIHGAYDHTLFASAVAAPLFERVAERLLILDHQII